ncbi:hypothetical protein Pfo_024145 [Paulownia fortunei]|nr:hypothetical protein Pfo_024145 [Paulownia fortunei]
MLSLGKFPTQVQYNTLLHNPISQYLQFPSKPHFSFSARLNFHAVLGKMQNGLCCHALKTKEKGEFSLAEMDGPDEFEDEFDDEFLDVEDDGEFEGDDDDDEVVIPLKNMKKWLENRPRGFGEGQVYDTSIEDKLMEEIEQSRQAQLANVNKLKNSPVKPGSKKETSEQDKGSTHIVDGFRVRLVNLPKKKNIQRDLQLAFKGVPGIINIVPIVSGNEKTRDPVCKGLAFIDFKYQDEAQRFVQNFSGKNISFGKVQKQIKCEMMNAKLLKPACDQSVESNSTPQQAVLNVDEDLDAGVETDVSLSDSWEESVPIELDDADETHVSEQWEDDGEINGSSTTSDSILAEELEVGEESAINSSSPKQIRKLKMNEKKVASKKRKDRIPKFNIPGAANRLKMREKAVLTGVFSKYGANSTLTVKEQSR